MTIDASTMRQTMGRFATGVAVITTEHECEVDRILDAGDHTVVIGQVVRTCTSPGQSLGFFAGRFGDVISHDAEPEHWFF